MNKIIKISYPTEDQSAMLASYPFNSDDASPEQIEEWAFEEMAIAAKAAGGKLHRVTDFGAEWIFEFENQLEAPAWASITRATDGA